LCKSGFAPKIPKMATKKSNKPKIKNSDDKESNRLFIILIVLGAALLWIGLNQPNQASSYSSVSPKNNLTTQKIDNSINSHMRLTERKLLDTQLARDLDNRLTTRTNPEADPFSIGKGHDASLGVDLEQENKAAQVYKDISKPSIRYDIDSDPEEKIRAQMALQKWMAEYDQRYKEQYIKAFIENARRAGYRLEVNGELEVTKVEKIDNRMPQSDSRSGDGAGGGIR
jgi:hypothetical protein